MEDSHETDILEERDQEYDDFWIIVDNETEPITIPVKATPAILRIPSTIADKEIKPNTSPFKATPVTLQMPGTEESSRKLCWRCGKLGHRRTKCRGTPVLFCSGCKTIGVKSRDCCKRPKAIKF